MSAAENTAHETPNMQDTRIKYRLSVFLEHKKNAVNDKKLIY